jgi:hypothetical protein
MSPTRRYTSGLGRPSCAREAQGRLARAVLALAHPPEAGLAWPQARAHARGAG